MRRQRDLHIYEKWVRVQGRVESRTDAWKRKEIPSEEEDHLLRGRLALGHEAWQRKRRVLKWRRV